MNLTEKVKDLVSRYYALFMMIALGLSILLRFLNLGTSSLTDSEAQRALQVLNLVNGRSTIIGGQPGYVGLMSFLFFLFGGSNFFARFWPAIFGTGLVLVPCLLRKYINDLTGIILVFLIALEPGLVALSRTANGTMIMVTSLLAALGLLLNRKIIPAGVLFGISLLCSEEFYPLILGFGLAYVLVFATGKRNEDNRVEVELITAIKSRWLVLTLSVVITIVLISSQFFLHPNGISGIGTGLADYFQSWRQRSPMTMPSFLLIFIAAEFPAILFGVWGLIRGLMARSQVARLMGLWWGIGLILRLLNPSLTVWNIVIINLPLFFLAATQISALVEALKVDSTIVTIIETVITLSLLLFSTLNFLNLINFPPGDPIMVRNRLIGILLPLVLWIAFTMLLAWGWDTVSTKSGVLIGIGLLLFALLVGSGWKAAGLGSRPGNEFFTDAGFISGNTTVVQTMNDVSRWTNGQATRIDVDLVGLNSPSLIWALRDFDKLTMDSVFPIETTPSIVVSSVDSQVRTQTSYRGQLVVWSIRPDFSQMKWQDWLKWSFFRVIPQQKEKILLWVRNDLFRGISTPLQTP